MGRPLKTGRIEVARLSLQIDFANGQQVKAERDGDLTLSETWFGYVQALRWVEDQVKRNAALAVAKANDPARFRK